MMNFQKRNAWLFHQVKKRKRSLLFRRRRVMVEGGGIGEKMEEGGREGQRGTENSGSLFCYVTSIQTKYFLLEITNILIRFYMF